MSGCVLTRNDRSITELQGALGRMMAVRNSSADPAWEVPLVQVLVLGFRIFVSVSLKPVHMLASWWAKPVLEGCVATPVPTPRLSVRPTCYTVLRYQRSSEPARFSTYSALR